jgi:hypothetical protein
MNALSPLFLWLIPLALLPVIIHLLNRLRYQTVPWAAMMFLRSADRDSSRRARLRQWLILASRCLMLLLFLLALARLQSRGRLARFFDPGSNLVIILFDRSVSMEQERGGVTGRERAVRLLQQGLNELDRSARVLWMDSATGELIPLPTGVDLARFPLTASTSTSSDLAGMVRRALTEIAKADVTQSEIWIAADRQSSSWLPEGVAPPDWSDWAGLQDQVTLRMLDSSQQPADPGNRALILLSEPERTDVGTLRMELALQRDTSTPESVPIQIEAGGLSLREDIQVEGTVYQWEQDLPLSAEGAITHARFSLPADTNQRDNQVSVAWRDPGVRVAGGNGLNPETLRILRAALLPEDGVREWRSSPQPGPEHLLWMSAGPLEPESPLERWVHQGGILVQWPADADLPPPEENGEPLTVSSWNEVDGVLSTRRRDPLRLDLVTVRSAVDLPETPDTRVLARLSDGRPFLTRNSVGAGAVYRWATLPDAAVSNLRDGYVIVPVMQRFLREAAGRAELTGTREVGGVQLEHPERWTSLDDAAASVQLDAGRFRNGEHLLALNRPRPEDRPEELSLAELSAWAEPLTFRIFEDRSPEGQSGESRSEFTGILALLALLFLVIESWLLTRNLRTPRRHRTRWESARA